MRACKPKLAANLVRNIHGTFAGSFAPRRWAAAVTLVEIMVTTAVLMIAIVGTSGYRYYAALDARKADKLRTAADIALLLCENWRGLKGSQTYDPAAHLASSLAITTVTDEFTGPTDPDFSLLGVYQVAVQGTNYYAVLSWKDVDAGLRAISIVVTWPKRDQLTTQIADADASFTLTTYTLN